jgi:hypothetical protein
MTLITNILEDFLLKITPYFSRKILKKYLNTFIDKKEVLLTFIQKLKRISLTRFYSLNKFLLRSI